MWNWVKSFFGMSKVMDTANDAMRKLGGLDELNSKERLEGFVTILEATKHQSPARRFIATLVALVWAILILAWLLGSWLYGSAEVAYIKDFMKEVVAEPFNYIIGFYFVSQLLSGIKK